MVFLSAVNLSVASDDEQIIERHAVATLLRRQAQRAEAERLQLRYLIVR
jgi:hypothetical protein